MKQSLLLILYYNIVRKYCKHSKKMIYKSNNNFFIVIKKYNINMYVIVKKIYANNKFFLVYCMSHVKNHLFIYYY